MKRLMAIKATQKRLKNNYTFLVIASPPCIYFIKTIREFTMVKSLLGLLLTSLQLFCSENRRQPLVRRDFDLQYQQLNYYKNITPTVELWAAKQISRSLGPIYFARYSDDRELRREAADIFHSLENTYAQQTEHKDEKN